MRIVIPVFDRFTALDAVGPYEVLSRLPGAEVVFAAATAEAMQLSIEYDPEPPFDSGSLAKAVPSTAQLVPSAATATPPQAPSLPNR